jgi:hypothetical protein
MACRASYEFREIGQESDKREEKRIAKTKNEYSTVVEVVAV